MRLLLIVLLALPSLAWGNAAMPGFFNVGTGHALMPLTPSDSAAATHVQMSRELVVMQLYKGFAGVRGEYLFYNNADTSITITMGYPVATEYRQQQVFMVGTDSIYKLRVLVDGNMAELGYISKDSSANNWRGPYEGDFAAWHTWQLTFPPKDSLSVQVDFMLNTNWAQLRRGYDREHTCGAGYVLQSGAPWAGKIGRGRIVLEMMQDMPSDFMVGILPKGRFKHNGEQLYVWDFASLEPTAEDNVLIRYYTRDSDFNFIQAAQNAKTVYNRLDQRADDLPAVDKNWQAFTRAKFRPEEKTAYVITGVLVVFAISVIGISVGSIILIRNWLRKRKQRV
ncbi:MAG: hypothetical protein ACOCZ8_01980 [Bacteroidota bacterium]